MGRHSEEFKSLYEFLFKVFVESDAEERGAITRAQFDVLIEDAAKAPRAVGLAPSSAQADPTEQAKYAARQAEFDAMDTDRTGTITFDKFFNWTIQHIAQKVQDAQGGVRFSAQPAPQVQYVQAAPVQYAAAPVQYAAAPTYAAAPQYAAAPTYAAA